jgi:hypothetical protein
MTDVVYLPGQEGRRQVRSWRLRVDGGFARVIALGTLPGGRWWVAALWEYPTGYGRVYGDEDAAEVEARSLRDACPGVWTEMWAAPAVVAP